MAISGYFFYYCGITVQPNDEEQYDELNDFDIYVHLCQEEIKAKEPKREPFLETTYYSPTWAEINFRFKVSYRDGTEDIYRYIDLVKEEIETTLNVIIIDFQLEHIS